MPLSMSRSRTRARTTKRRVRSRSGASSGSRYKSGDANMIGQIMVPRGGVGGDTFKLTRITSLNPVWNTQDGLQAGTIVTSGPGTEDIVIQQFVSLSLLPNFADVKSLFSQYKITELEYHLINCVATDVNITQGGGVTLNTSQRNLPVYFGAQNDLLNPASKLQCQQEEGVVLRDYMNGGKPFICKIKNPTYFVPVISNLTTLATSPAQESNGWLSTDDDLVQYRGFFLCLENAASLFGGASLQQVFNMRVKVSMIFRGVR